MKSRYCIGVDLGGTNIAVGLVNLETKRILKTHSIKTNAPRPCEEISRDIVDVCKKVVGMASIKMSDVLWIGIATPGIVKGDIVISAVNLGWENAPLAKYITEMTGIASYIANDANAAAFAEATWGAGSGKKSLIAFTLGTGVGGGIVIDGKIWEGANGFAAELGHMVIAPNGETCGCGKQGCIEAYCSATALVRESKRKMRENKNSLMWKVVDGDIDRVNGKTPFSAMEKGDKDATDVVNEFFDNLSLGVSNIINIFQPDVVCIGGGISREGDTLLLPLRERVLKNTFGIDTSRTELVTATFKNDAGIIGAALLGLQGGSMKESEILEHFSISGNVVSSVPYGSGHINDTKLITVENEGTVSRYILQKINTKIFKDPEALMKNYVGVTSYLKKIIEQNGGDSSRETLNVITTTDGENFYLTPDGEAWRLLTFITDSKSYDLVENPEQFYTSAVAFGNFQYLLRDYPADTLFEIIKNFHNTPDRVRIFEEALKADVCGRAKNVKAEIDFVLARREFANTLEVAREEGRLPLRVTHNDTKLNNILFDKNTGKPLCIVDLDTIMPGYSVNDFGDSIRFGATTALEDEVDLTKVNFDISLYEHYVRGFIEGTKGGLTECEMELLPIGAIMMTYECGTRFLTDYLSGDTYFKISRENHNLDRARNQFKLVSDMEARLDEMKAIVKKYI